MSHSECIKRFNFPESFAPPTSLDFDDLHARPLKRTDLEDDMEGVNSSLETIRQTRGGSWPEEAVTKDFDLLDLAWHEREFRDGDSFAYVVYNKSGEYTGCFYLYPMGHRTPLTEELADYDMDASWWVTAAAYEKGYYEKLYAALGQWLDVFPVKKIYYSNKQIPTK